MLREIATYSIINDEIVVSPSRALYGLQPGTIDVAIEFFLIYILKFEFLFRKLADDFFVQLERHFSSSSMKEESESYARLEKTLNRILPSLIDLLGRLKSGESKLTVHREILGKFPDADDSFKKLLLYFDLAQEVFRLSASEADIELNRDIGMAKIASDKK